MSTAKSLFEHETDANSLLESSPVQSRGRSTHERQQLEHIRERYRNEFLEFRAEKELRVREKLMRLEYVIKNTLELNEILENIHQ
jgi:hypothetical protein